MKLTDNEIRDINRYLERKRDAAWREYDIAGREIEKQKDGLIYTIENLFTIQWKLI